MPRENSEISSKSSLKSALRFNTKNAWAKYARRRWPLNGVKLAQAEFGLTLGEAKGLFAAQASQHTIDKILDHPHGGFRLGLLLLEIRFRTTLAEFLKADIERLHDDAEKAEAAASSLARIVSSLPRDLGQAPVAIRARADPVTRRSDH